MIPTLNVLYVPPQHLPRHHPPPRSLPPQCLPPRLRSPPHPRRVSPSSRRPRVLPLRRAFHSWCKMCGVWCLEQRKQLSTMQF